jgi:hypothetical protein
VTAAVWPWSASGLSMSPPCSCTGRKPHYRPINSLFDNKHWQYLFPFFSPNKQSRLRFFSWNHFSIVLSTKCTEEDSQMFARTVPRGNFGSGYSESSPRNVPGRQSWIFDEKPTPARCADPFPRPKRQWRLTRSRALSASDRTAGKTGLATVVWHAVNRGSRQPCRNLTEGSLRTLSRGLALPSWPFKTASHTNETAPAEA